MVKLMGKVNLFSILVHSACLNVETLNQSMSVFRINEHTIGINERYKVCIPLIRV